MSLPTYHQATAPVESIPLTDNNTTKSLDPSTTNNSKGFDCFARLLGFLCFIIITAASIVNTVFSGIVLRQLTSRGSIERHANNIILTGLIFKVFQNIADLLMFILLICLLAMICTERCGYQRGAIRRAAAMVYNGLLGMNVTSSVLSGYWSLLQSGYLIEGPSDNDPWVGQSLGLLFVILNCTIGGSLGVLIGVRMWQWLQFKNTWGNWAVNGRPT